MYNSAEKYKIGPKICRPSMEWVESTSVVMPAVNHSQAWICWVQICGAERTVKFNLQEWWIRVTLGDKTHKIKIKEWTRTTVYTSLKEKEQEAN